MEILNQLLSNQADYLNALRHAQQMPVSPTPNTGGTTKFKVNGKHVILVAAAVGIFYLGYRIYKSLEKDNQTRTNRQ